MSAVYPPHWRDAALLILGHGASENPDSATPTLQRAEALRARGLFREVAAGFWKQAPKVKDVLEGLTSETVYIVPHFISEGYFTRDVLPQALELTGPTTLRAGKTVHYCDPVGCHSSMTKLLLKRAAEVAPGVPPSSISLVILGHGTARNAQSLEAIKNRVEEIRRGGPGIPAFAEVVDAYMEVPPLIADWDQYTSAPHVVVVPFFIADGLHSYEDIPVMLGIYEKNAGSLTANQGEVFKNNPYLRRGRRLYYSGAIGTEPSMAEVVLDQVAAFDAQHLAAPPPVAEAI